MHAKVKAAAMQNQLMVYPMGGTLDGVRGDHVLLAPAFIIDDQNVADIVERLSISINSVLDQIT